MELTAAQGRVLGALVEKERTTPQGYPLTDNALVAACNQTTSRDPVVGYDVATVRIAVRELRELGLVRTVHRSGERSDKHRHELEQALGLSPEQAALLAVLLLRGPQTLAELRARTERLETFATVDDVERELAAMADRDEPLVGLLPRQPGRKEARFGQLLAVAEGGGGAAAVSAPVSVAAQVSVASSSSPAAPAGAPGSAASPHPAVPQLATSFPPPSAASRTPEREADGLEAVVAGLVDEVATLRREVDDLREALERATGG